MLGCVLRGRAILLLIDTVMRLRVPSGLVNGMGLTLIRRGCLFVVLFFPIIRVVRCSALCGLGKCDEVSICALFRFDDASFLEFLQGVYPRRLRPRGGLHI